MATTARMGGTGAPRWLLIVEGIVLIALGIFLIAQPGATILLLLQILAIYWLVAGVLSIVRMVLADTHENWGWQLFTAIVEIVAGLAIFSYPLFSTVVVPSVLVILIACLAIVIGITGVIQSFRLRSWSIGLLGALGVIVGIVLFSSPLMAALTLTWLIGLCTIAGGIVTMIGSFRRSAY